MTDGLFQLDHEPKARDKLAVHYSSASDNWATPQDFFDKLDAEFHFNLDVCALPESAKCERYFIPEMDGLKQEWTGTCWMNPPYSDCATWMQKAYESSLKGATVVCLIPSRTDTKYWHSYVMKAAEIRFVKGRLKFGDSKNSAPFPSAVIVFRPSTQPLTVVSI